MHFYIFNIFKLGCATFKITQSDRVDVYYFASPLAPQGSPQHATEH